MALYDQRVSNELVYFQVTGFFYDLDGALRTGNSNAAQLIVREGFVTFTPRLVPLYVDDLDTGTSHQDTQLTINPVVAQIVNGELCSINWGDTPGVKLTSNCAALDLAALGIAHLVYDVTFTGAAVGLPNFAFVAPVDTTPICITDPTLPRLGYQGSSVPPLVLPNTVTPFTQVDRVGNTLVFQADGDAIPNPVDISDFVIPDLATITHSPPNLLLDGSYEQDATWWAGELARGGFALTTDQAFIGTHSMQITGSRSHYPNVTIPGTTGFNTTYGVLKAEAGGRLYRLSCKIWRKAGNTSAGFLRAQLHLQGASSADVLTGQGPTDAVNQSTITAGAWYTYTDYFVVPMSGTNYPYVGVYPELLFSGINAADVFYVDSMRFEDLTNSPFEIQAPAMTGNRTADSLAMQGCSDISQLYRGTVKLRAETYSVDVVTQALAQQPRFVGQGENQTQWDGTLKFQGHGHSNAFSGGWWSGIEFVGSHAGQAAVELNGCTDVHWDETRFAGTYDTGIWFHNELSGDFTEICNGRASFYSTVTTPLKYTVGAGSSSFHRSGLTDGAIQQSTAGPAVLIEAGARPYNAPLTCGIWSTSSSFPVIQHNGDAQANFHGNLTIEQSAVAPLAAGGYLFYAGTVSAYMGPGLAFSRGTFTRVAAGLQAVSGGTVTPLPLSVANGGGFDAYNTADQVTNFERIRMRYGAVTADTFSILSEQGGTGTRRPVQLASHGFLSVFGSAQTGDGGTINAFDNTPTPGTGILGTTGTLSAPSGVQFGLAVAPTINQTSTAGYTALKVNVTESATGSGAKLLIDAQVGGVSKFNVDRTGVITAAAVGTGAGSVVTTDGTQPLTLKTISGLSNTITGVSGELVSVRCAAEVGLTYTIVAGSVTQITGLVVDTVSPAVGERIAILGAPAATGVGSGNTNQPANGIYRVTSLAGGNIAVVREPDLSGSNSPWGTHAFVREGASWGGFYFYFNGTGAFTWGTTPLGWNTYFKPSGAIAAQQVKTGVAKISAGTKQWGVPGVFFTAQTTLALTANTASYHVFDVLYPLTVTAQQFEVTVAPASNANVRVGIYLADTDIQPTGAPLYDAGVAVASGFTGKKTTTGLSVVLNPGRYLMAVNCDVAMTLRTVICPATALLDAMGAAAMAARFTVAQTYGAFPSTPTAWTALTASTAGAYQLVELQW